MSKMACRCGGVISDVLIPCPTEGWILRDENQDAFYEGASRDIMAFCQAIQAGRRDEWVAAYFSADYPADVGDAGVVHDILCCHKRALFLSAAECKQCGRLFVQREPGVNSYRSYAPDEHGYAAVLRASAHSESESCPAPDAAGG